MNYTVLIGDIKSSKKIEAKARSKIQITVEKKLNEINNAHKKGILSPLKITLGDEFQAVFKTPKDAWEIVQKISMELKMLDIESRFAIVEDELYTKINKIEPLKMDGPAFWKARELIGIKKKRYSFHVANLDQNEFLSIFGEVLESIEDNWKKVQLIYIYETFGKKMNTVTGIAKKFDKNKATISRALKRSRFELYNKITNKISSLLEGTNAT